MTNTMNDTMILTNACADVAQGIARELRDMRRPSITPTQIFNRLSDYLRDDPNCALTDDAIWSAAYDIASHPAIRTHALTR